VGEILQRLLDKAPDIIDKAAQNPLGLASLSTLVLGAVVFFLFRDAVGRQKLHALAMITGCFLGLMTLVLVFASNPKSPAILPQPDKSSPEKAAFGDQDDPLFVDVPLFHAEDWTVAINLISISFGKINPHEVTSVTPPVGRTLRASEEFSQLQVFINESDQTLAEIALTDYRMGGVHPTLIEAYARRISKDDLQAYTLKLRKKYNLVSMDSDEIFTVANELTDRFSAAGMELGFVRVDNGVHKEGARAGFLSLTANDTTPRIGPVSQGIRPGEGVALIVRMHFPYYWGEIMSGIQDSIGARTPYPTRLTILCVRAENEAVEFNPSTLKTDFILPDGRSVVNWEGSSVKINKKYLVARTSLMQKGVKSTYYWAWQ
jgi:hypothetical protein